MIGNRIMIAAMAGALVALTTGDGVTAQSAPLTKIW